MSTRVAASLLACSFILILVQLVAFLVGPVTGILCGSLVAVVSMLLFRFFQLELSVEWPAVMIPTGSSLVATAIVFFTRADRTPEVWLAGVLAIACSLAILGFRHFSSRRCELCSRRLGGELAFNCPRCGLLVCDRCWRFELSRCQLCERNHVPILPPDARWWDRHLGPRTPYGRCQLCMIPAEEGDLRACHNCGRPQCRDCWDTANGQCNRCRWIVDDLPASLRPYVPIASAIELRGSRSGRQKGA